MKIVPEQMLIYLIMLLCLVHCISGCPLQCDHYKRGIISGSCCKALCDQRTLRLQHCMSPSSTHQAKRYNPSRFHCISVGGPDTKCVVFIVSSLQVYSGVWKERPVVIKCGVEDPVQSNGAPQSVLHQEMSLYDKPTRGTSMDEFKEMVHSFLKVPFLYYFQNTLQNISHARKQKRNCFVGLWVNVSTQLSSVILSCRIN